MSLFRSTVLTKISFMPGVLVKGRWTEGIETRTEFSGTWQPASGQDLQKLPEGKRNDETFKCFAPIEVAFTAADADKSVSGDRIEKDGVRYEVILAAPWNNGLLPHWELLCKKEKEGER
jgi:hypothetical protein|nr:MAG TPA: Minor capsid protein [Caudoviricetes sp.]